MQTSFHHFPTTMSFPPSPRFSLALVDGENAKSRYMMGEMRELNETMWGGEKIVRGKCCRRSRLHVLCIKYMLERRNPSQPNQRSGITHTHNVSKTYKIIHWTTSRADTLSIKAFSPFCAMHKSCAKETSAHTWELQRGWWCCKMEENKHTRRCRIDIDRYLHKRARIATWKTFILWFNAWMCFEF